MCIRDRALADTFIKSWKEVGLDVKLVDGKLMAPKDWSQRCLLYTSKSCRFYKKKTCFQKIVRKF